MSVLLDTNILTRVTESAHPHHQSATDAVSLLMSRQETLCLVPQNLYEFWVVCTRPASDNGLGMTAPIAERHLGDLQRAFELLDETPAFRPAWEALVAQYDVKGKSGHDARLVAAMKVHGLTTLLTFNAKHFRRFNDITVITPDGILSQRTEAP